MGSGSGLSLGLGLGLGSGLSLTGWYFEMFSLNLEHAAWHSTSSALFSTVSTVNIQTKFLIKCIICQLKGK